MATNYFVCTLGQALHQPKTKATSIPEFLHLQAERYGLLPAVGFAGLAGESTSMLSFRQLNEETREAARRLIYYVPELKKSLGHGATVALLAHSDLDFLKTWLGLIRLGFSVLLLAPQLDKASIDHLCGERDAKYLFHDAYHASKAKEIEGLKLVQLRPEMLSARSKDTPKIESQIIPRGRGPSVPYLHHSSGTSSGKPKAIPQTNAGAFAALPSMETSSLAATFSSTPLYHGGVADCFRAWTSHQMIWLFPGGKKPITAQTVRECLSVADRRASSGSTTPVKYFSSVPYVLRDLVADDRGMELLRRMDIVGVGGAAFPTALGQKLVDQGVNLVSRYGSAECGFLLSSYRNFDADKEWDYLRSDLGAEYLSFEPHDSGLFELVVKPGWPHMAKTNRHDGSYATADLFEKHPVRSNAWRYHSRADAQITLVSGKKFDPEPIEIAILSTCPPGLVLDVLVFGDGENYPGALVFVQNIPEWSLDEVLQKIWPTIDDVNQKNPSHARLSKAMLKVIPLENEMLPPLEKNSKGTTLRRKAEERYRDQMKQVMEGQSSGPSMTYSVDSESDMVDAVVRIVEEATGKSLAKNVDFFEQGVDSVACIQIRKAIQNLITTLRQQSEPASARNGNKEAFTDQTDELVSKSWFHDVGDLPPNLLYDCGTIERVVDYLLGRHTPAEEEDDLLLMQELAAKYSQFHIPTSPAGSPPRTEEASTGLVVVLTGATGALGTHILDILRSRHDVLRIYCLLRASDPSAAHSRIDHALRSKAKVGLDAAVAAGSWAGEKVVCLPCNLAQSDLGLGGGWMSEIGSRVDLIVHAAWAVNFTLRLKSFESHLAGVQALLNLGFGGAAAAAATAGSTTGAVVAEGEGSANRRVKFVFCSSIASVSGSGGGGCVSERISEDASAASPLGYSRSKWVAESICVKAGRAARSAGVALDVDILRIGQLCGDSEHGIWNTTEAWPLMLSSFDLVGCLPELVGERLNWLPLDIAAGAVCEIAVEEQGTERAGGRGMDAQIYHVVNPHVEPSWAEMLRWLSEKEDGRLRVVEPAVWLRSLEDCLEREHPDHPSRKLLALWKGAYLAQQDGRRDGQPGFGVELAAKASAHLAGVKPVSRGLVEKMWSWIRSSIRVDGTGGSVQ